MSDFYDNLLKATDNTSEITTEKYAIVTKIDGLFCSVKETDTDLEHSNVPILNGAPLQTGDKVIIGFLNNSIYDVVCYGALDKTVHDDTKQDILISGENIKTVNNESLLGSGNISISGGGGLSIDDVYPVGSIYMSVNSTSPQTLFGGTWERIKDTFLLASGDTYSNGSTGGSADAVVVMHRHKFDRTYALTTDSQEGVDRISSAGETGTKVNNLLQSNGGPIYRNVMQVEGESGTGKNMPPYLSVYMWKRTA